jgi:type IV pilus assembly protein PilV
MQKKAYKNIFSNSRGFSLLEVLLGVTVFMIGMLGITALNISSLKSNTYSGNLSEATMIAADKIEELMSLEFTDDPDTTDNLLEDRPADDDGGWTTEQDANENGIDDDDEGTNVDGVLNFGLDHNTAATADHVEADQGKNDMYDVYWNVAEGEPFDFCKRINVIVTWSVKDVPRQININTIRCREM